MRASRTSKSKPRHQMELLRPALIITLFGVAAVLQVGACARVTVINSDLQLLEVQEAEYEADIQTLRSRLAGLRDASTLHEYMIGSGLTKETAVVDVTVEGLPAELLETLPRVEPAASAVAEVAERSGTASGGETGAVIASLAQ